VDMIIVRGGKRLRGEVAISGAKNAALPILVSSLLAAGCHSYRNVPALVDIRTVKKLLQSLGAETDEGDPLHIDTTRIHNCEASYELVKTMRASILVLGPLVARCGEARVSLPGGCAIGARPVNLHIKALRELGAEIAVQEGYITARARRLKGTTIYFDLVTVTGTENIMMAACLAEGTTCLKNAAREPEVVNLAATLNAMGARIAGAGSDEIVITGVPELHPAEATIIPDRIEAGTYMVASALTHGDVVLEGVELGHMATVVDRLRYSGVSIEDLGDGATRVVGPQIVRPQDITTSPFPGFPTDMQAQFMVLLTQASGTSIITETIFDRRFLHVNELLRLGAAIEVSNDKAIVRGITPLSGAEVTATDLRASASLVLAGLIAHGTTVINEVEHIDRGYESIEEKLRGLGARIERIRA